MIPNSENSPPSIDVDKCIYLFTTSALVLVTAIASNKSAVAVSFNFSYAPGTTLEQAIAMEMAGSIWSNYLADDATVNLHVETTDLLPQNVVGGSLPGFKANQSYEDWSSSLNGDATTSNDSLTVNNLPGSDPVGIMAPLLTAGERRNISTLDRQAFDAIGWDEQAGNIDLATLETQAKESLAQRLEVTVEWLETNPEEAIQLLSQDRTQEVQTMIKNSQIYSWGSRGKNRGSGW